MMSSVTRRRLVLVVRLWHARLKQDQTPKPNDRAGFLFRSLSSSSSFYNFHLRKRRKQPHSSQQAKWLDMFNHRQAMQSLKRSAAATPTAHLLSALVDAFNIYNCDPTPSAYHFVIKTLIRASQFRQLHPVLDRLQRVEEFETPEYILVDLIKAYGNASMAADAVGLFFRIPTFRCTPSVFSLNALLSVLCKKREGLLIVPQILLKSLAMNIWIEESSFCILIKALCTIREVNCAIKLLNFMINNGYSLQSSLCSLILSTLCEQKDLSGIEVVGFLEEIRKLGFCADRADCCKVIRFLSKKGKGMDALDVLYHMKVDGIKPDIVCYTMVLDGVIAEGKYAKVDELFDEMLVLGLVPDICTYNVYIRGLCMQNKMEEGTKMLCCMEELGCKPDLITYNTLLEGFCKVGELSKARKLVKEMELKGVPQDSQTYGIMINGLVRVGGFDEASTMFRKMLDDCLVPHSSTLDGIICGLCQAGLVCNAMELLEEMGGKNAAFGTLAWEALILGFGFKSCFEECSSYSSLIPTHSN